jgi:hypothetical protein
MKTTKFILAALLVCLGCTPMSAQLAWNAGNWVVKAAGITANITADGTLQVSSLPLNGTGPNYRADIRYNGTVTFATAEPIFALKLKTSHSTLVVGDRKMNLEYMYYPAEGGQLTAFSQKNKTTSLFFDTDKDGANDTYLWNLSTILGAAFVDGLSYPSNDMVWTNGSNPGSERGTLAFVIMLAPDAGATQNDVSYEVFHAGTFTTQEAAIAALTELQSSINTPQPEDNFRYYSENGILHIVSDKTQNLDVYGIDGRLCKKTELVKGENTLTLPAGIYIVNRQKIVAK